METMEPIFDEIELEPRQEAIVNLLKSDPERWFTQEEVVAQYPAQIYSDGYQLNYKKSTHDKCSAIWDDIKEINNSGIMVVAVNRCRYKYANPGEAFDYITKLEQDAIKKLVRASRLRKSYRLNGQGMPSDNGAVKGYVETLYGGKKE